MRAPQIVMIVISALGFGLTWASHGKPKTGKENAWYTLSALVVTHAILWWGGFYG